MYNIAIIGTGALGKRHLESVLKSEVPLNIYVVDSDEIAVDFAKKIDETRIKGGTSIDVLPEKIDVAIIATTSRARRTVFEQLATHSKVNYVIFEKVLFQREKDYYEVEKLLQKYDIKAWVNCPYREYENYQYLQKILCDSDYFTFELTAGAYWGLGCNTIHMLDLVQYLSSEQSLTVNDVQLFPMIVESKRKGYKEIFGRISGHAGKCISFSIECFPDSTLPTVINIAANNFRCTVLENQTKMWYMSENNNWEIVEKNFDMPYQSQLTQKVVENILTTGHCELTEYKESMKLHLEYVLPLIKFFEKHGMEKGICPIT